MLFEDFFDEPLKIIHLMPRYQGDEGFAESFPFDVFYGLRLASNFSKFKDIQKLENSVLKLLSPIELENKRIVWAWVEYKIFVDEFRSEATFDLTTVLSCSEEKTLLDQINNLETEDFWDESENHRALYELFLQKSKVKVYRGEGQRVKNGKLLLGTRIGPEKHNLSALVHEMGHFIEIDDGRILKNGWGFYYGKPVQILGRVYYEPTSCKATLRECRAIAIQRKIEEVIGVEDNIQKSLSALIHVHDWHMVPGKNNDERFSYLIGYTNEFSKTLSIENILKEWERKQELL